MTLVLVDANVLSESTKVAPEPAVLSWLSEHRSAIVINPIVLGEIEFGILKLPNGKQKNRLQRWFESGIEQLKVLRLTAQTAHCWASLLSNLESRGKNMPVKDSLIAATALEHEIAIATRNERDFVHCGVRLVNPFSHEIERSS